MTDQLKVTSELIDSLFPWDENPRDITQEAFEGLCESLKTFGMPEPLVANTVNRRIIGGHQRWGAAKKLGWLYVPVAWVTIEDPLQEEALNVTLNNPKIQGEYNQDKLQKILGRLQPHFGELKFSSLNLAPLFIPQPTQEQNDTEDEVPEIIPEPVVKRGELWILGEHRLLIDDCTVKENVERLMAGEKAELCFTSPPYSDQRDYSGELELTPKHLAKFFAAPCSLFAVNLGMKRDGGEVAPYWNDYIETAKTHGHKFLSWNVWDRGHAYSIGQMTAMFPIEHEWIFVFGLSKDLNLTVPNKSAGEVNDHRGVRQKDGTVHKEKDMKIRSHRPIGTVMRIAPHMSREETRHPAMFPVSLPEEYINACTKSGDSVFEPFSGSGSTLIACEKTNRRCFGTEIDPTYGQVILERWQKYTGLTAYREDGVTLDQLRN